MGTPRPYRATIYLPGHDEAGRLVAVRRLSAATQEGLERAMAPWLAEGYLPVAYEVIELPLELDT